MAQTIPLIRSAALVPFLRWAQWNRVDLDAILRAVGLASLPYFPVEQPVSVIAAGAFCRDLQRREGPDIGCRVVSETSVMELGTFGRLVLGSATPREAMKRIEYLAPYHNTHEVFAVREEAGYLILRESLTLPLDAETRHIAQQYVATLIRSICVMAGRHESTFARVELTPHPDFGLDHLRPWLGPHLAPSRTSGLLLAIPPAVADRPFPAVTRNLPIRPPPEDWMPLRGDGTLTYSARIVMSVLLEDDTATIDQLAAASGMSVRSLQRRLGAEGTSFKALLADIRREIALRKLSDRNGSTFGEISAILGYSSQSALTRAVRRWTGATPRAFRNTP
ncbi:AraC family transcriptional regulator [uncultured Jannaschia sp.]|uniref:AraC family transcriptional regulator n=1 Tax=uncultured Jannaschia sp. TaxID=293347 RepID=UPI00260E51D9|nr:AraC family transcriptional regulator [uncultured Jannaschia sp.]